MAGLPSWTQQFVKMLADHSIMSAADAGAAVAALPVADRPDAGRLTQALAKQGKLTWYQAALLSQGKADQLVLGNYVLLDKIGEGGFGSVFKARHRRMQRVVAVKLLLPEVTRDPKALQRFQREVQAAAQLNHPNIVTAHDADEARGVHFLAMEFVDGPDLGRLVKKQGPLPPEQAVAHVLQAARGLAHAHAAGIIHRDVKPSNLLLGRDGVVKVSDLGLARVVQPERGSDTDALTATKNIMGTVDYMSPEQALNTKTVDARADIYSLGCTLYTLLVGGPIYFGDSALAIVLAHREKPIPQLPSQAARLQGILTRLVAKRPEDRYSSMASVAAELEKQVGSPAAAAPAAAAVALSAISIDDVAEALPASSLSAMENTPRSSAQRSLSETATTVLPASGVAVIRPLLQSAARRKRWWAVGGAAGLLVFLAAVSWIAFGGRGDTNSTNPTGVGTSTQSTAVAERPAADLPGLIRQCVKQGKVRRTNEIGGAFANRNFEELPNDGGILVGFEVGTGKFVSNDTIGYLRPIYLVDGAEKFGADVGRRPASVTTVKAKPGYALGSMRIGAGGVMDGLAITFMRQKGKFLDSKDAYESQWVGGPGGGTGTRIGGDGSLVIGIFGKVLGDGQPGRLGLIFPDIPTDWMVVFRSDDPSIWNDDVNKGPNYFAQALELLPDTVSYLKLTNTQTNEFVIIEMSKQRLTRVSDDGRYGWDGTNGFHYRVYHLGIFLRIWPPTGEGQVMITRHGPARGWGFGDLTGPNEGIQGFSWAGKPIPKTVFEIAVKAGSLTEAESKKLLKAGVVRE